MKAEALAALVSVHTGRPVAPSRVLQLHRWGFVAADAGGAWRVTSDGLAELRAQVRAGRLGASSIAPPRLRPSELALARAMVGAPAEGRSIGELRTATGLSDPTIRRGLRALGGTATRGRASRWHLPHAAELVGEEP